MLNHKHLLIHTHSTILELCRYFVLIIQLSHGYNIITRNVPVSSKDNVEY